MKEDLLYYLWRMKRFDLKDLKTTDGDPIIISDTGKRNLHSGPDFTDARIQIGDTLWAGNVEMHIKASDWLAHKHQEDQAYDSVILHVVVENDRVVKRKSGAAIPCLELKKRIPAKLSRTYNKLLHNEYWIPCQHLFHKVSPVTRSLWLDRLLVERLESKTQEIEYGLKLNQNNWEETFYQFIARNFGVKINAAPFEQLAKSIPLLTLIKHKSSLFQLEALLFGQAGLLEKTFGDNYPRRLQKEYRFLRIKHGLAPVKSESWKFMRLRPANFPTIRIAQFATLIYQSVHLFSKILAAKNVREIENMFEIKISNYWQTHYIFDKASVKRNKSFGKNAIHLLIINTIAPFLFYYGKAKDKPRYKEKALSLLEALKPEKNHIIDNWKALGLQPESAFQTQALLQLKNQYCSAKKCMECSIGNAVMASDS